MENREKLVLPFLFLVVAMLWNSTPLAAPSSGDVMNGYKLSLFKDFQRDWKLVTVRFRKDTGEMRFTYANEAAWNALKANESSYPDGAIFAKYNVMTKDDPSFPSSAVPSGARRIQFMVRNASLHADTGGWGYALFDTQGAVFPGDQKTNSMACAACHALVPERGYVFSQPFEIAGGVQSHKSSWHNLLQFEEKKLSTAPASLRKFLPAEVKKIRLLRGQMTDHYFSGTLDEIRPLLAMEAFRTKSPVALVSKNKKSFSLVFLEKNSRCGEGQLAMVGLHTLSETNDAIYRVEFCQSSAP